MKVTKDQFFQSTNELLIFVGSSIAFIGLAFWLWCKDLYWLQVDSSAWVCIIGVWLYYYCGKPWMLKRSRSSVSWAHVCMIFCFCLLGGILDMLWPWVFAWALAVQMGIQYFFEKKTYSKRLLVFLVLAFPWVLLDGQAISWYLRMGAASVAADIFWILGAEVQQEGVILFVQGMPLIVEPACAGLGTLEVMLLVGGYLTFGFFKNSKIYWWMLGLLVGIAWASNVMRIVLLGGVGIYFGPEVAMGLFHDWGGVLLIVLMFICTLSIFAGVKRFTKTL